MFKSIINSLFPSLDSADHQPNYEYFEQSNEQETIDKEDLGEQFRQQASRQNNLANSLNNFPAFTPHQEIFYNYLFGEDNVSDHQDPLSDFVSTKINELLLSNTNFLDEIPIMPESVKTIMSALEGNEFNIDNISTIIAREPSMAADLINMANSAKYKRGDKNITEINRAFMNIGSKGVMEGILTVYLKKMTPSATIYFKQFGAKIWQHCEKNAVMAKSLASDNLTSEEVESAYFIGLLRNIGSMIIFQLMLEAFYHVDPNSSPSSHMFKRLMFIHSLPLTLKIVKKWSLPDTIIDAIEQQQTSWSTKAPLATCINDAHFLSTMTTLWDENKITDEEFTSWSTTALRSESAQHFAMEYLAERVDC